MNRAHPTTECGDRHAGCGQQIGHRDHVVCYDGVTGAVVAFHKECNPNRVDVQQNHKLTLDPLVFNTRLHEVK